MISFDRPRKEIPIDEMDIHLMNDEKAPASHFRATAFQTEENLSFEKAIDGKVRSDVVSKLQSKVNFAPIPGDATLVPPPEVKQQRPDGEYTTEDEDNAITFHQLGTTTKRRTFSNSTPLKEPKIARRSYARLLLAVAFRHPCEALEVEASSGDLFSGRFGRYEPSS